MPATFLEESFPVHNPQENCTYYGGWKATFFPVQEDSRFIISMLLSCITLGPELGITKGTRK